MCNEVQTHVAIGGIQIRRKRRILLVEDEHIVRLVVAKKLEGDGYEVTEAGNGVEALDAYERDGPFDLLVTDIEMPVMDGIRLIDELRKIDVFIPVLVMSGSHDWPILDKLSRRGCTDLLRKPFLYDELTHRVSNIMKG
jgi:CheY-like chemotaxis protein